MPRKGEVPKRKPLPDPKFTDAPMDARRRLSKFMNVVMRDGKKSTAEFVPLLNIYYHRWKGE